MNIRDVPLADRKRLAKALDDILDAQTVPEYDAATARYDELAAELRARPTAPQTP